MCICVPEHVYMFYLYVCLHVIVDSLWVVCILADRENVRQIQ